LFLFAAIIYLCVKTLYVGLRALREIPDSGGAQTWGLALIAGLEATGFPVERMR